MYLSSVRRPGSGAHWPDGWRPPAAGSASSGDGPNPSPNGIPTPSENPFFQAAADVTDPAAAVAVLERLVQRMGGMDLCLVAAGAGELNPELDYALELPAIRTNVVGWTAVVD